MTVSTIKETLEIDNVTSVSVSDIEADADSGGYVRRVEFYTDALDQSNRTPVLTVMLYGSQAQLKIITPKLAF